MYFSCTTWVHKSINVAVVVVELLSCVQLFCNPMDYSPPGSFVHGISQARLLEWVTISFSRGSSHPRDQTQVPWLAGRFFTTEPPGKPLSFVCLLIEEVSFLLEDMGLSHLDCMWHWICGCSCSLILLTGYEFQKGRTGNQKVLLLGVCEFVLCDPLTF